MLAARYHGRYGSYGSYGSARVFSRVVSKSMTMTSKTMSSKSMTSKSMTVGVGMTVEAGVGVGRRHQAPRVRSVRIGSVLGTSTGMSMGMGMGMNMGMNMGMRMGATCVVRGALLVTYAPNHMLHPMYDMSMDSP